MKKLLFLSFLALPFVTNAQISQGNIQLGLNLSFSNSTDEINSVGTQVYKTTNNFFIIAPDFDYFITDKISIGGSVIYKTTSYKELNSPTEGSNEFYIGPRLGYYKMIGDRFGLLVNTAFYYHSESLEQSDGSGSTIKLDGTGFEMNIKPGFIYFLSDKFAFRGDINGFTYTTMRYEPSGGGNIEEKTNDVQVGLNTFGLSLGLSIFIK
jgi:hypothetical protein